jgi:Tol biopolymer transport system component
LDDIILECLEKDIDERCQSAKELAKDLRKIKKTTGNRKSKVYKVDTNTFTTQPDQTPVSQSSGSFSVEVLNHRFDLTKLFRFKYLPWLLVSVLSVVIIYFVFGNRSTSKDTFIKFEQLTEQSGQELYPDISPDGNYITYTKLVGSFQHIFLQRIGGGNAIDLTKDSGFNNYQSSFSPDGEMIAFRSDRDGGGIFLMGSTGESVRRLTNFGFNPVWSPDGNKVLFATESVEHPYSRGTTSQLWTADVRTGDSRKIYDGDAVQPSWSPNGKWIAYWGLPKGTGKRDLWMISASGSNPVKITDDDFINWSPTWSPDGQFIYFSSNRGGSMNLWRVKIDDNSGKILSESEPVITPAFYSAMARMSRDGKKMIYVSSETRDNIYKVNFDPVDEKVTGLLAPVTQGSKQYLYPDVSPDGKWIAVSSAGQQEDIYIIRTDGSDLLKLTNDVFKDRNPQWAPDGKSIIFYSDRTGKYEIWRINTDGSNLKQLTHSPELITQARWFPDGRSIVSVYSYDNAIFSSDSADVNQFKYLPKLNEKGMMFAVHSVSPDGNYIAGNRMEQTTGKYVGIILYSLITKSYTKLSDTGQGPKWFLDSKRILYADDSHFYVLDITTGARRLIFNSPELLPEWSYFAFSPDNKSIYIVKEEKESDIWMGYLN